MANGPTPRSLILQNGPQPGRRTYPYVQPERYGKMPKPFYYSKLRQPGGQTYRQWSHDAYHIKWKGWLADPGPLPDDALRKKCFALCKRPRCRRARRCKFFMPLALRENRQRLFKDVPIFKTAGAFKAVLTDVEWLWPCRKSPLRRKRGEPRVKPQLPF